MTKLTELLDLRCDIFEALRDFLIRRPEPPRHGCGFLGAALYLYDVFVERA